MRQPLPLALLKDSLMDAFDGKEKKYTGFPSLDPADFQARSSGPYSPDPGEIAIWEEGNERLARVREARRTEHWRWPLSKKKTSVSVPI